MDGKDIQMIWNAQNAEAFYGFDPGAFEKQVIAKSESVRRRFNFCELTLAAIFGITGALAIAEPILEGKDRHQYFTGGLFLLVAAGVIIQWWLRRRLQTNFDGSLMQIIDGAIRQIESHVRFLRLAWLWLGLPYVIVVGVGFVLQGGGKPGWLWAMLFMGLPLAMWLTLRDIPRVHLPQLADLRGLRATLAEADEVERKDCLNERSGVDLQS